jgi:hypothetical protein
MVYIDLSESFLNLDGTKAINAPMGKTLSHQFAQANSDSPAKYMTWAVQLWKDSYFEVSESELKEIVSFIEKNQALTNLAKHQLLEQISKCENRVAKNSEAQ